MESRIDQRIETRLVARAVATIETIHDGRLVRGRGMTVDESNSHAKTMGEMFAYPGLTVKTSTERRRWLPVVLPWLQNCWSFGTLSTK